MTADLSWLPAPPQDFAARLAAAEALPDPQAWDALVALSRTRLDPARTNRLDRVVQRRFPEDSPAGPAVRLALLGSSTLSHLAAGIRVGALRRDLRLIVWEGAYGQYQREIDGDSLRDARPDVVLLALDAVELLGPGDPAAGPEAAGIADALGRLRALWARARAAHGCTVIQQTLLPTALPLIGANEHRMPGSLAARTARLNAALRDAAAEEGVDLLALDDAVSRHGLESWHDPALWLRARQAVTPAAGPLYGDLVARLVGARLGRSAKALVLDLDDTLWGGTVGEDGLDGIVVGQGSALGESFLALQSYARDLSRRGIVLAICSKNDPEAARRPFAEHPDMLLRLSDFAVVVANWDDKVTNLRRIAQDLRLGLDALVFVDDNPFERALVRAHLPMVAVPEVPDEPALVARCLADAGYFEAATLTDEDRQRTKAYAPDRLRPAPAGPDLAATLAGLGMRLVWRPFDSIGLPRIVQLVNKTNQFNLTTRRLREAEAAALIEDPAALTLQFRLTDRLGDNGVIAVVIGRFAGGDLVVETWLMSCRVIGRRVEEGTLAILAAEAARRGARRLVGLYRPSGRNGMVADLYPRLGFRPEPDGEGRWALDLAGYAPPADLPMAVAPG
ncbi:HAD-superfamily phosphatase, subfamily IIIC/FkbH-like domain-containing protein [Methylobacterium sp. 174MFSha1.1]|uniref:HAD-IIIC family phosphatase n=1 Tax=Methylobacterium sp. 174MFSha1.1 TaxID=1502749 RepID=UPI0008DF971B|nr:HAD-IIIC family phosphatase [Methylobacterium sp. 174MFSha1.1]SFU57237.1 HAD-superfamily phosphatase, subfamily IIIC/FkbH-like domain-containing protein [Methylobacterium sp. 174MFSha1.1]